MEQWRTRKKKLYAIVWHILCCESELKSQKKKKKKIEQSKAADDEGANTEIICCMQWKFGRRNVVFLAV